MKCKIEWRKDTQVTQGPRGRYKGPKDKCSIGDNPPITALTSPCGVLQIRTGSIHQLNFRALSGYDVTSYNSARSHIDIVVILHFFTTNFLNMWKGLNHQLVRKLLRMPMIFCWKYVKWILSKHNWIIEWDDPRQQDRTGTEH